MDIRLLVKSLAYSFVAISTTVLAAAGLAYLVAVKPLVALAAILVFIFCVVWFEVYESMQSKEILRKLK